MRLEHGALGVGDLPVEYLQVAGLGMVAEPEDVADGSEVFRPVIGAGEHHDRADPGELPAPPPVQHPGEEPLQDEATLAVGDERNVGCLS